MVSKGPSGRDAEESNSSTLAPVIVSSLPASLASRNRPLRILLCPSFSSDRKSDRASHAMMYLPHVGQSTWFNPKRALTGLQSPRQMGQFSNCITASPHLSLCFPLPCCRPPHVAAERGSLSAVRRSRCRGDAVFVLLKALQLLMRALRITYQLRQRHWDIIYPTLLSRLHSYRFITPLRRVRPCGCESPGRRGARKSCRRRSRRSWRRR